MTKYLKIMQLWLFGLVMSASIAYGQERSGPETVTFDIGCPEIKHEVIGAITKDGIEFNKKRLTIGVAEEVKLTLDKKWGNVTWTVTPASAGKIISKSTGNNIVEFHAGLDAGTAVIKALPDKTCTKSPLLELTFTIKAPRLVYFKACDLHLGNRYSSGIKLESYLVPDDVSFHNVSYQEENALSVGWAAWKPFGNKPHIPTGSTSPWIGCHEGTGSAFNIRSGRGTDTGFYDTAYFDPKNGFGSVKDGLMEWMPPTPGSITFIIPSNYAKYDIKTTTRNLLPVMTQAHTMTAPNIGTSKGGVSYDVQLTDPSTPTQWTDTDCK